MLRESGNKYQSRQCSSITDYKVTFLLQPDLSGALPFAQWMREMWLAPLSFNCFEQPLLISTALVVKHVHRIYKYVTSTFAYIILLERLLRRRYIG